MYALVTAILVFSCGISQSTSSDAYSEEETKPVIAWLKRWPARDIDLGNEPKMPYNQWVEMGKKIRNLREKILYLAVEKTSVVDLASVAMALGDIGKQEDVPLLIQYLHSGDYYVREKALFALQKLRDLRAQNVLIDLLNNKSGISISNSESCNICLVLGDIGNEQSLPILKRISENSEARLGKYAKQAMENIEGRINAPNR